MIKHIVIQDKNVSLFKNDQTVPKQKFCNNKKRENGN